MLPNRNDSAPAGDPIDALLDAHLAGNAEELAPSSGFVLAVMDSVRAEASEPPPIAFPWRRVIPGAVAAVCGLVVLLIFALRAIHSATASKAGTHLHAPLTLSFNPTLTPSEAAVGWVLLAACLSALAIAASFRLTGRSD